MHLELRHAELMQAIVDRPYIARPSTPESRALILAGYVTPAVISIDTMLLELTDSGRAVLADYRAENSKLGRPEPMPVRNQFGNGVL